MNIEITARTNQRGNNYIKETNYKSIIVFLAIASSFVGHISILDYLIATAWMIAALYLFDKDDFWVLFIPLSVFENTIFFYFTDYTIFKILLLLSIAKLAISMFRHSKLVLNRYMLAFILMSGYAILNLVDFLPGNISLIICVITIFMICFSSYKMRDCEFFKRAMFGFAIFAIAAGIYGLLHGNSVVVNQNGVEMLRFCGTSADPNIMSYKFILGMIALMYIDFKSRALKTILEIFLVLMIFRTGSTTAIIALCLVAVITLLLQKASPQKNIVISLSCVIIASLALNLNKLLIFLSNFDFLSISTERLLEQHRLLVGGDISEATSFRTDIWEGYINYFSSQQGIFEQLFGGNVTNIYAIEKNFAGMPWKAAAHNTNIDILMCVGIVGLIIIYYISIKELVSDIKLYRKKEEKVIAMRIIIKAITIFYTFSLSMFLSYGFMVFLL